MARALIEKMVQDYAFTRLADGALSDALRDVQSLVVLVAGNPKDYPEANDLAIVLPELMKAFQGQFEVAVVDEASERAFAQQYGVNQFPCLVFFKSGQYVDQIARMQDWSEYMKAIPIILEKEATRAPSIGIPVVAR